MLTLRQIELLRMHNKFVFLSLLTVVCICGSLSSFCQNIDFHVLLGALFILLIPSLAEKLIKLDPPNMQWLLLACGNMSIFYLNKSFMSYSNWLLFVLYLIVISVYQSQKVTIIFSIVTLLEFISLIYTYNFFQDPIMYIPYIYSFSILYFATVYGIHTKKLKQFWQRLEQIKMKKQQELLSQDSYLQLFFEHANDCIAVFGLDNRVIDVNPAFEEVYGWKKSECVGKIIPLVPPENSMDAENRYLELLEGKCVKVLETKDMKKDGTVFDVTISLSPIYNRKGEMVATSVISRDITNEKEHDQLKLQSEKLKLAGDIAAGVAHEIRNPLTVISGFVQMMNNDQNSIYHPYTEIIQSEIDRINLIISEFLVLSKPQAQQFKEISINQTIQNVIDFYHLEFLKYEISCSLHINGEHNIVLGNENQLKQVFINIIKNSIEAIELNHCKGKLDVSIHQDSNQLIYIAITDNGIGMSNYLINRIFDPFFTTKDNGTGLGMLITKKIIQDHGGKIEIDSKEKYGTTINIHLKAI